MSELHLLNGDSIAPQFEKSGLPGRAFVWREVLCEGQADTDLTSERHWQHRQVHLNETYSFFEQQLFDDLKSGFLALDPHLYDAVYLWFEYDLFCQVNMMGLLSWLSSKRYMDNVYLVCVGEHPDYDRLVGLGELTQAQFTAMIDCRQKLNGDDLAIVSTLWKQWCEGHHHKLVETSQQLDQVRFPYMTPALKAHLQRFPHTSTLLTEIESAILNLISDRPRSAKEIVGQLLRRDNYYGFGDVQYYNILEGLKPLLKEEQELLRLNEAALNQFQEISQGSLIRENYYGGASQTDFTYNSNNQTLNKT